MGDSTKCQIVRVKAEAEMDGANPPPAVAEGRVRPAAVLEASEIRRGVVTSRAPSATTATRNIPSGAERSMWKAEQRTCPSGCVMR